MRQDREAYLDEDANHYRRPIVCNRYRTPIELFDRHLYEKGSLVLHMLRRVTGDELFFKSLNLYCTRHRGANVITQDLQRAFEDTTGRSLDFFFDQWVYKEGHPEIEVSSSFDDKKKLLSIAVKQTHKTGDTIASAFSFPVTIALMDAEGHETRHRVEIKDREQGFNFVVDKAPKAVRFDPEFDIVKTLKHKRGREALETELRHAPEAIGRAAAARELGIEGSPQATAALRDAMIADKFWGVQADAATALGTIRTTAALDALIEGLKLPHPKARRAVVRALGNFRGDARAASALADIVAAGDESYFVEAEAVLALGKTRDERAFASLTEALGRDSYLEVIRTHAIAGMAELRDERAIDVARDFSAYGRPPRARVAAVGALARFAATQRQPARRNSRFHDSAGRRSRVHGADAHPVRVRRDRRSARATGAATPGRARSRRPGAAPCQRRDRVDQRGSQPRRGRPEIARRHRQAARRQQEVAGAARQDRSARARQARLIRSRTGRSPLRRRRPTGLLLASAPSDYSRVMRPVRGILFSL